MLQSYISINFLTIMILLATLTMMYVNRDVKIPATKLFMVSITLMFVLTITAVYDNDIEVTGLTAAEAAKIISTRKLASVVGYIVRPCVILTEVLIILQNKKNRVFCIIPAVLNAAVYLTALFGSSIAFYIDEENLWHGGPLKITIYITLFIYLLMLLNSSIASFKSGDRRKSVILLLMFVQAVLVAIEEYGSDTPHGNSDEIMALCVLEYYLYLTNVYRQELNDKLDAYVDEIEKAGVKLKSLTGEVIEALASAIDAKDKYTHGHSSRVAEYSRKLAEMNGKTEQECDKVYYAALLHDVGKIGISDSIITKEGKLTDEEYAEIKKHPVLGMNILHRISEFPYLAVGAAGHHERYDGRGYPYGLKGTDIPELARIIAVADAYDAMSSKRSYRDPIPQEKVREEIVKGIGTQFDPDYALLMLKLIDADKDYKMREHHERNYTVE